MNQKQLGWLCLSLGLGLLSTPSWATDVREAIRMVFDPQLRELVHQSILGSQRTIDLELYKLTDRDVIADLKHAAARQVRIRIILCPSETGNQATAVALLRAGVAVRWYPLTHPKQIMHLKAAVMDGKHMIFGSPNWTYWGLSLHHEGVLEINAHPVIREMEQQFAIDWEKSLTVRP